MEGPLQPTPFNPGADLAPTPFEERHCSLALRLKEAGLTWRPHAGCFVWDPEESIQVSSPFPGRVYFILNLGHFTRLLGTPEEVARKLVWLPTWHQARQIGERLGIRDEEVTKLFTDRRAPAPGEELLGLYERILQRLSG